MSNFEVIWITQGKANAPRSYWTKAACGFDAVCDFKLWASKNILIKTKALSAKRVNI